MTGACEVRLISDRLAGIAQEDPDRELIFDPVFGRFSYAAIEAQVRRLSCGLASYGIGPGDIVILQLPNWAPFITFHIVLDVHQQTPGLGHRDGDFEGILDLHGDSFPSETSKAWRVVGEAHGSRHPHPGRLRIAVSRQHDRETDFGRIFTRTLRVTLRTQPGVPFILR